MITEIIEQSQEITADMLDQWLIEYINRISPAASQEKMK